MNKNKSVIKYGVCDCSKWGQAPLNFNEAKHFLKCECGKLMYLQIFDPREAGYRKEDEITPTIVNQ